MDELNALLKAAQKGDLDATGELLERFQSMATGYAYSLLGDEHLAEDAVQAAYFEACLQLSRVYSAEAVPANGKDAATALDINNRVRKEQDAARRVRVTFAPG